MPMLEAKDIPLCPHWLAKSLGSGDVSITARAPACQAEPRSSRPDGQLGQQEVVAHCCMIVGERPNFSPLNTMKPYLRANR
jgi:hypothetical protein